MKIRPMRDEDLEAVITLWREAGLTRPYNDPQRDIEFARQSPASDILVGEIDGILTASCMVGHDGHRGVIYYLCVAPAQQGKGLGRQILHAAEDWLKARGVWKLNLMIRMDNTRVRDFYLATGYAEEERLVMSRWLDEAANPQSNKSD